MRTKMRWILIAGLLLLSACGRETEEQAAVPVPVEAAELDPSAPEIADQDGGSAASIRDDHRDAIEPPDDGDPSAEPSPKQPEPEEWTVERLLEEHPIFSDPRLDETDQIDPSQMAPNEFYPSHVQVGDQIAGLTVVSVMREHIDLKSYTIEFEGELILEGSLHVLREEERGTQSSDVYFTLDEQSFGHFPQDKRFSGPDRIISLGVTNGLDFVQAGDPIEDKPIKAKFHKLLLQFSPSKSADSWVELVEIFSS